ncbi:hypothetical protein BJ912DRAFT_1146414 [Pholiota molesta]|nr:hypothetical protein BJ912DRAFT_1146414 [Pholiota molesta]
MATTPPAVSPAASEPALWLNDTRSQPLLQRSDADNKQEPDNAPVDLGPAPRGLGPIQLAPDIDEATDTSSARQPWRCNHLLEEIPAEHRSVLRDLGKGCLYIITTPIAFAAVGLYACGKIIEGVALILKGVGSFGVSFLMDRRNRAPQSPTPEAWVGLDHSG